jgi:outer membrane receptor for ferrienterochelin and colicin
VLIEANDRKGGLREFYEHKDQRQTFAKFLDQEEIRKRSPMYSSDLFRSVPGISIKSANYNGNTIRIRGCQPMLWVDGQRVPGAELDEVIPPDDIAGIEFYTSMAGVPAQYMERQNRACGTIMVWTKKR